MSETQTTEPEVTLPASTEPEVTPVQQLETDPVVPEWVGKRIDTLTARFREAERDNERLRQQISLLSAAIQPEQPAAPAPVPAAPPQPRITQADLDQEISRGVAEQRFIEQCNGLLAEGTKVHNDFTVMMDKFKPLGGLPRPLVEAILEVDAPHEVLYSLATDLNEAARIFELSPLRQAAAITKYALAQQGRKKTSTAPAPLNPVRAASGGGGDNLSPANTQIDMATWVRNREAALKAKASA